MFENFPLPVNLALFALLAAVLWQAGTRLSYIIDAIAEHTRLARAFLGLVFLASATSLPELATTVPAAMTGSATLALNNLYGGIALQTAVLAIVDAVFCRRPITSYPRSETPVIEAILLILGLALTLVIGIIGDIVVLGHIGLGGIGLGAFYVASLYWLQKWQKGRHWSPLDLPDDAGDPEGERQNRYDRMGPRKLGLLSLVASVLILACGYSLVKTAEALAVQTGLGESFVGASLLAATTSLPELSTSAAAVRVRAHSMAISNIIGSNLIMVFLVLPADLVFVEGSILDHMDTAGQLALIAGLVVTAILGLGLLVRSRRRVLGMGLDSLAILLVYIATLVGLYMLR